ncbi:TlyA family RNA methyltransferase [Paremcibacter congregatus]|uniref:TlyA family RNA methyltransferase n=1 Tax=Paremcibacter congregatus TaxID=2043170 RepID=UPI0030ED846A|tara:strand:+ start:368 stop:1141 length:774 start_codon:yes stop_codon:yes gene_type:complete
MAKKKRVDQLIVDRGLADSRSKAQALIMAGAVFSGEKKIDKAGTQVAEDVALEVRGKQHPWVSRGGLKLVQAIEEFSLNLQDKTVVDVGASTGGFTDVCLHHGAAKVYAVDVGHGQLAWKLRNDDRVVVLEKTNARYLTSEQIPDRLDMIVCDASFIGLQTVLPAAMSLAAEGCILAALIKPQFEVGKGNVGKGGVVRDPDLHAEVCDKIEHWIAGDMPGWTVQGITTSPIKGPEGNIEFLIVAEYHNTDESEHDQS